MSSSVTEHSSTASSASASTSTSRLGIVESSRRYRDSVLTALRSGGWDPELERSALAAVQGLARARQGDFTPKIGRAMLAMAQTALFIVAPLVAAERLWHAGWGWAAVPLVLLAGMGIYGGVAVLHDFAHASLLPSKRANNVLGHLLAPFLLMEFAGFRRSHLDHHRHSQSTIDPKRFGVEHKPETMHPDHSSLDLFPAPIRTLLRMGAKMVSLPMWMRHMVYLLILPLFMGPAVLFFSGEFSIARRDWRKVESWTATLASAVFLAGLYLLSPKLLALFLIALLIGHAFTFNVFATHLTPNQVYWTTARRVGIAEALNVSDIHCGSLVRWLGHGLSDYHSTHHLSPTIPCYHLPEAEAMVAPALAPWRAPALNLLHPASCALLYDAVFSGAVYKNSESWDYADQGGMRRPATPESDR